MKKIIDNWQVSVFTVLLATLIPLLINNCNGKLYAIKEASPKSYVDSTARTIKNEFDTKLEKKVDKSQFDILVQKMDDQKNQNDVNEQRIYEIWKEIKHK